MNKRENFAAAALTGLCQCLPASDIERIALGHVEGRKIAKAAVILTDRLIEALGERDTEMELLRSRAERAETSNSVLLNLGGEEHFSSRVALSQIWEFLGTKNQTDAMQMLRDAFPESQP